MPSEPNVEQIIEQSLSISSNVLHFTVEKHSSNPNVLINTKTANCVGYACFFAATCNYLLSKYELNDTWTAKPQIGQLNLFGKNIHHFFRSAFFKDHDFVTIENKRNGKLFAVDPTLNDYLLIDLVTYKK
jgi:hypothetical protein